MFIFGRTPFRNLIAGLILSTIFFIDTATFAQISSPSTWSHVATYDEGFYSPGEFRILGGENDKPRRLLVLDHYASDQALAHLRLEDGSPIGRTIQFGQGPGEVSGRGMEISLFSEGGVLLWDNGQHRANVYGPALRFEGQVEGLQDLSVDPVALVNDSTLAVGMSVSTSDLFRVYRLHRGPGSIHVGEKPLATIETTDHEVLNQGQIDENFMIRQGVARRVEEGLYFGFMFGSLVTGMTERGVQWATAEPLNHALPVYNFRDGNAVVAPQLDMFARGILDLTGDASHLYVLYSGQKMGGDRGLLGQITRRDVAAEREAISHSDRLFVFDRATGKFVKEMRLPIRARGIEVTSSYAVLYVTEEKEAPTFEIYRIPETDGSS